LADSFDELPWQHAMAFVVADANDARHQQRQFASAFAEELRRGNRMTSDAFAVEGWPSKELVAPKSTSPLELRGGIDGELLVRGVADRELRMRRDAEGRWWFVGAVADQPAIRPHGGTCTFYAMHTGTGGGSPDAQAALVAELGFDGLAWGLEGLAAARFAAEQRGGDVISAYAVLDVDAVTPNDDDPALASLVAAMEALRGGPGQLWLALTRSRTVPNDEAFDLPTAVLRRLLPHARRTGVEIALYPHHGFWLHGHGQALQLCEKVGAVEVGITFNLCHWLRAKEGEDVGAAVRALGQRLFAVTIHGADRDGEDWSTLIRPLGEGSFAVDALLRTLDAEGFEGPMALQGYGLRTPPREHLTASLAAWRRLHERSRSPSTRRE
jgi:sugar phosphate isomerase/epimerase